MTKRCSLSILLMLLVFPVVAIDVVGYWKGEVATLPVIFNISQRDGVFKALLDSPKQGAKDVPCGDVKVENDSVLIDMPALQARFTGAMQADMIMGMFTQRGVSMPLILTRTTKDAVVLDRPQTPKPPFLYNNENVKFSHDTITLAGTLTTPLWGSCHPAVVLVSGSGVQNRDEEIIGHKPFAVIADYLSRSGIAVLRYDDRGAGGSSKLSRDATTYDFADDVIAAIDYLKTRKDIDASRIGILGHSEGGTIAFMCAAQRPDDVDFVISLAGVAIKGKNVMIQQNKMIAEFAGQSMTLDQEVIVNEIFNVIDTIDDVKQMTSRLKEIMMTSSVYSAEKVSRDITTMTTPWYIEFVRLDPSEYLLATKCLVLALNGDWDVQVDADMNLNAVKKFIPTATVKKYPRLNHLFQESASKSQSLNYGEITQTISPIVLEDIARWIISGH